MSGKPVSLSKMMELVGAKWTCVFRATLMGRGWEVVLIWPNSQSFALPPPWGVGCVLGPYASNRNNNKYNIRSGSRPYIEFPWLWSPSLLLWLIVFWPTLNVSNYIRFIYDTRSKPQLNPPTFWVLFRANMKMMSWNFNFIYHQFFMHPFWPYHLSISIFCGFQFQAFARLVAMAHEMRYKIQTCEYNCGLFCDIEARCLCDKRKIDDIIRETP